MPKRKVPDLHELLRGKRADSLVVPELLTNLVSAWGGSAEFAKAFHTEFHAAAAGGVVRARMLDSIVRLFTVHTANLKGNVRSTGDMTDAELAAAFQSLSQVEQDGPDTDASAA